MNPSGKNIMLLFVEIFSVFQNQKFLQLSGLFFITVLLKCLKDCNWHYKYSGLK